jgi:hypothetical protein
VAKLERVKGIEPSYAAWEAAVLPLNYTRDGTEHRPAIRILQRWRGLPLTKLRIYGTTAKGENALKA